jgi:hypothetical protein
MRVSKRTKRARRRRVLLLLLSRGSMMEISTLT